jgi:hypothetical protein
MRQSDDVIGEATGLPGDVERRNLFILDDQYVGGGVHGDLLGERGHAFFAMITDLGMPATSGLSCRAVSRRWQHGQSCAVEQAERILILDEGYPDGSPPQTSRYRPSNFAILRKRGEFSAAHFIGPRG